VFRVPTGKKCRSMFKVKRFKGRYSGKLARFENSRNVEMTEGVGDQHAANSFGSEYYMRREA
jgi:hypothetical protein